MPKPNENLKEQFFERYNQLQDSALLLDDTINLLYFINSEKECEIKLQDFIPKISEYKACSEDITAVKRILEELNKNKREFNVALAELNYLYDVASYKVQRMIFMSEQFNCFF